MDNCTGFTHILEEGVVLGKTVRIVDVVSPRHPDSQDHPRVTQVMSADVSWGKKDLCHIVDCGESGLLPSERDNLKLVLSEYHQVLSLEAGERGETDLMQFEISTVDALPKKQPPWRIPHAAQ